MLGYIKVIETATMDFPDGQQRFNWCNCQPSVRNNTAPGLRPGLGSIAAPITPIFDFSWWSRALNGGGGPVGSPESVVTGPYALPSLMTPDGGFSVWALALAAAVAVGAVFLMRKGGKR